MRVICPQRKPDGRTFYDWSKDGLQTWIDQAIKLQNAHVKDNNETIWFKFLPEDGYALELRILITIYGVRTPQDSKNVSSNLFSPYTSDEIKSARSLKKTIIKHSSDPGEIKLNVIYISTASEYVNNKVPVDKNFYATEEPVFVVNGQKNVRKFIDKDSRLYEDFEDYKKSNSLNKSAMVFPKDGTYTPSKEQMYNDKVWLEVGETPSTSILSRVHDLTGKVVTVAGIAFSVTGVVTFFSPNLLASCVQSVVGTGSYLLSGYSILQSSYNIVDKINHDENIRTDVFALVSAVSSMYFGSIRQKVSKMTIEGIRKGETFQETLDKIEKLNKNLFYVASAISVISSASGLVSAIFDLATKRERTWLDYYQLSMSLFIFTNVVTKPITLKGVFESEQMKYLSELEKSQSSEEAKQSMKTMLAEHKTSDEKAYFIRNVNKIENPSEFFELIGKTGSTVKCTVDGLLVNNNIEISPLAYNEIGSAVYNERLNQQKLKSDNLPVKVSESFLKGIPEGRREEFKSRLNKIRDSPFSERKEDTKALINELSTTDQSQEFERIWTKDQKELADSLTKITNDFGQGSTQPNQKEDFEALRKLTEKKVQGTITPNEQKELDSKIEQCSKHRKEYFFKSSKFDLDNANVKQKNQFKKDIQTFTNGRNERLCYQIHINEMKENLQRVTETCDLDQYKVNGVNVFENMKTKDCDRLYRVYTNIDEENRDKIFKAAIGIATDTNFKGDVKTPSDIASIVEAIQTDADYKTAIIRNLQNGRRSVFISEFNSVIEAVNKLDADITSKWGSKLSMAYHWMKHIDDFENRTISKQTRIENFFINHSEQIFTSTNIIGSSHNQSGGIRATYARSFGKRLHVGFTFGTGESERIATHFLKA